MLPIGDSNPRRRFPWVTVLLIGANTVVHIYQMFLPASAQQSFVLQAGLIARDVTHNPGLPVAFDMLTSIFLHGSWLHLLGNMLYLWVFGDNIEERLGTIGFIAFYLLAGIGAALAQVAANPNSTTPMIGASGAIAGVLGAYLVIFPRARVRTLILFRFILVRELPAVIVLGFWFVLQLINGLLGAGNADGGVAWFAHIGGFVIGVLVGLLVRNRETEQSFYVTTP